MNPVEYMMRGGCHANKRTEEFERAIAKTALQAFMTNPHFAKKGLKWTYNKVHFGTFYCSSDPQILDYLYEVQPYPDYIEVEITTCCSFKCKMCEHTYWKEKQENMSFKDFKHIVDQFPRLKWIGLTGIGESYLNPDFHKIMKYVKDKGIFVELFDVFYYLGEEQAKFLIEQGVDKIYISLDAATKETYEKIRVNSNWDKVISNLVRFDRLKKKYKSYFPELHFHFIVSKDNQHEIEKYLDMIADLGIDVKGVQYTRCLHSYKEIKDMFVEIPNEKKEAVIKKGQKLGIPVVWNVDTVGSKRPLKDCSVWWMPFIFVDGTVIPCCSLNEQNDRPWQRKTSLGNIFKEDFRKIWYGKKYKAMLKALKEGKCPPVCKRCILYEHPEVEE